MTDGSQDPAFTPSSEAPGEDSSSKESKELAPADRPDESDRSDIDDITGQVEQPAKVMRIGTMIKQLLEEVRQAPMDEAGRKRLREIHESSVKELATGLAPELREELERLSLPFGGEVPSEAELRVAQAQLVGWLEGLFHGIQTALYAQQAQARQQLEQMMGRRAVEPGGGGQRQIVVGPDGQMIMPRQADGDDSGRGTGQYL
ncbi:bacterial proteasome activator family protein [Jatrophihabitans fulvus]